MTRTPTSVVIAGAGLMGRWHGYFALRLGARVAAVVDTDEAAAARLARRLHTAARQRPATFGTLDGCLAATDAPIVHLCTPSEGHATGARAALEARRHVLVEKPLAGDEAATRALLALAQQRGVSLAPVHQLPFQRGIRALVLERDRLGQLVHLSFRICSAGGEGKDERARRRILVEMLPHPVSLFRAIRGTGAPPGDWHLISSGGDDLELHQSHEGVQLSISLSLRGRPTRHELVATGTRATARADLFHGYSVLETGRTSRASKATAPLRHAGKALATAGTNLAGRALRGEPAYPGLPELIAAFHASAAGAAPPAVHVDEILESAALVDRAWAMLGRT